MADIPDPPESLPESFVFQQQRDKRKKRLLVLLIVAVLGGGGAGLWYWLKGMGAKAWHDAELAFSELSTCVLGDPLGEGETVPRRLRGIALAQGADDVYRGKAPLWLHGCAGRGHKLSEMLRAAGRTEVTQLGDDAVALAGLLEQRKPFAELQEPLSKLWAGAAKHGLKATRIEGEVEAPPKPLTTLNVDGLEASARLAGLTFNPKSMTREPFPAGNPRFLIDEQNLQGGPRLCDYLPESKTIKCAVIPPPAAEHSPKLQLWGTTEPGAVPYVFAGDRGDAGIFRSDTGAKLTARIAYGATARQSGALQMLIWNAEEKAVDLAVQKMGDKEPLKKKIIDYETSGHPYYNTALFWDWFVYKDFDDDSGVLHLYARRVDERFSKWGDLVDVGEVLEPSRVDFENQPHFEACRTQQTLVLRVRGNRNDRLTFNIDGSWTKPVVSPGIGGQLSCVGDEAVILRPELGQLVRCKAAGCQSFSFSLPRVPDSDMKPSVAEVGGKIAVVFRDGPYGGLRLLVAPPGDVGESQLIFDDLIRKGDATDLSTLLSAGLVPGRGYALLILSTVEGNFLFHLDPSGQLTPVKTAG